MSNPPFPNPAEVCKSRGWKRDTKAKDSHGNDRIIGYVSDEDWIVTRLADTKHLSIWGKSWDITGWTEVKPVPVVTVDGPEDDLQIYIGTDPSDFGIVSFMSAATRFGEARAAEIVRIMAEAGKAAIEAELGTGKDAAGAKPEPVKAEARPRFTAEVRAKRTCPDDYRLTLAGHQVAFITTPITVPEGFTRDTLNLAMLQFVAAGLAALNGEAKQPVATQEGPWRVDRKCEPSLGIVNGDRVALSVMHHGGHVEYREISERHAHQMAAELNALHAKANVKADQT